jgi:hypothetical protein
MLVHIVEPRQEREIRIRRAFSRLKGLDHLNRCPIIRAYAAKSATPALAVPLPAFVDGELRAPGGAAATEPDELPDEIVKRGPQVVSELPDEEPDTGIGHLPFETKDILAGIGIEITPDAAVFQVKEGAFFAVDRAQVLVRSFESQIDGF